ncbi:hypothetical protein COE08_27940 [Priestia megaterium]|uniref:Uncharacterized protein n=2 Tax=Priestia megaterium TaxID=1404 RepID=A0AAE5UC83_PRIMG|nr:hypothetical protein CN492_23590 [Priestia megaterium]PES38514.1 hypothetical protein CN497_12080 [Priestia megaterium]PEU53139.1 hypothetical protein CN395_26750 [Priestia megaterium]PFE29103.1 hypothetical protein CN270_28495 [Priestia megaterium]PFJ38635.1 hypothetical protein COJ00_28960 [Priestia megaterium]
MKGYTVFIVSFIALLFVFQILSGLFLTLTYEPEMSGSFNSTISTVGNESVNYTFLTSIIAATISFITSKLLLKTINK